MFTSQIGELSWWITTVSWCRRANATIASLPAYVPGQPRHSTAENETTNRQINNDVSHRLLKSTSNFQALSKCIHFIHKNNLSTILHHPPCSSDWRDVHVPISREPLLPRNGHSEWLGVPLGGMDWLCLSVRPFWPLLKVYHGLPWQVASKQ